MASEEESTPPPPPSLPSSPPQEIQINEEQAQKTEQEPVTEAASDYEQLREQRIKENRERMQKLGIVDLSLKLKAMAPTRRTPRSQSERKTPLKSPSLVPSEPVRRSSRLQNVTPVTYTEPKEDKSRRSKDIVLEEGSKPEVYTEEQEKLLGITEMPWTFFVDGYRADGTRIYDPVNGKTCHQCRQKTMGRRTHCSTCNLVQGQFCGDCLYMRYGEHVVEATQNPNWLCPPCRGICNCSLCRQAKGWAPTGALYRRISSLGYKSVAHYLITTKRAPPNSEENDNTPQSAKRSLPFEAMEVPADDGSGHELNLDDKASGKKTDISSSSKGVGKSRKKSKKENAVDGQESVITNVSAENEPTSNMKGSEASASKDDSIAGRLRSRNRTSTAAVC